MFKPLWVWHDFLDTSLELTLRGQLTRSHVAVRTWFGFSGPFVDCAIERVAGPRLFEYDSGDEVTGNLPWDAFDHLRAQVEVDGPTRLRAELQEVLSFYGPTRTGNLGEAADSRGKAAGELEEPETALLLAIAPPMPSAREHARLAAQQREASRMVQAALLDLVALPEDSVGAEALSGMLAAQLARLSFYEASTKQWRTPLDPEAAARAAMVLEREMRRTPRRRKRATREPIQEVTQAASEAS